ncbi:MAG: hypothetical protein ACLQU1_05255 [Bryobacteraceae bacterium]
MVPWFQSGGYKLAQAVVEKLLRELPAGWFDDYDDRFSAAVASQARV